MPTGTYTAQLGDRTVKISRRDLAKFRDLHLAPCELSSRISELLWLDIFLFNLQGVDPEFVLLAIKNLENGTNHSGTKPEESFKGKLLKGLWHKHFFDARFMAKNIQIGLGGREIPRFKKALTEKWLGKKMTPEVAVELRDVFLSGFTHRAVNAKLTGEWIVYLKRGEKNYYLCCTIHDAGDQAIYDRITEHCPRDFPELKTWLKEEQDR
jgi:hypothetical protein